MYAAAKIREPACERMLSSRQFGRLFQEVRASGSLYIPKRLAKPRESRPSKNLLFVPSVRQCAITKYHQTRSAALTQSKTPTRIRQADPESIYDSFKTSADAQQLGQGNCHLRRVFASQSQGFSKCSSIFNLPVPCAQTLQSQL